MPKIKITVDNNEYTLECEEGEENELNKAVEIVNKKMLVFKGESNINKTTKLLMVSILLASEINENQRKKQIDVEKLKDIEKLIEKLKDLV